MFKTTRMCLAKSIHHYCTKPAGQARIVRVFITEDKHHLRDVVTDEVFHKQIGSLEEMRLATELFSAHSRNLKYITHDEIALQKFLEHDRKMTIGDAFGIFTVLLACSIVGVFIYIIIFVK
jgi:hypothetical protein